MNNTDKEVIKIIDKMLPNREKVRFYIWDNLEAPLSSELEIYFKKNIESFGSWKEVNRGNGQLAYKGWIYRKKKQGHWVYLYKNGKLHKDCYYRNNEYHSKCTFWGEDGSHEVIEYYKGRINGERLCYNSEGVLYQKWVYEMGHNVEFYGPVELGLIKSTFS